MTLVNSKFDLSLTYMSFVNLKCVKNKHLFQRVVCLMAIYTHFQCNFPRQS